MKCYGCGAIGKCDIMYNGEWHCSSACTVFGKYEAKDRDGHTIMDIWEDEKGIFIAYKYRCNDGSIGASTIGSKLITRKKEKKFRPFKASEVPVGFIVVNKTSRARVLITGAFKDENNVDRFCTNGWCNCGIGGAGWMPTSELLNLFERCDGSPCGVEE